MGRLALAHAVRAFVAETLDVLYPPLCWLCRRADAVDGLACAAHRLERGPREHACRRCGRTLAAALPAGSLCAACRQRPPGFARLVALGTYRSAEPLREWILALKHGGRRDLALPLGTRLGACWRAAEDARSERAPALLVPVPLHPARRIERGYDQAGLLALHAGEEAGLEVRGFLRRVRWTAPQGAGLSRAANVRDAFRVRRRAGLELARRAVVLVDDVVTSGATVEACSAALRAAGAGRVSVLCLARADADPGDARP